MKDISNIIIFSMGRSIYWVINQYEMYVNFDYDIQ